jgi:diguanylate cyclase (GGDEF)-like protein/PAS domain S-box-containing protein
VRTSGRLGQRSCRAPVPVLDMAADEGLREAVLRQSERSQYEIALACVSDAVITTDASYRIVFLNAAAESLTGWDSVEAIGKPLAAIFSKTDSGTDDINEIPLDPGAALSARAFMAPLVHATLLDKRGFHIGVEYKAFRILNDNNEFVGAVIVARDIARQRAAEITLFAHEKSLLENADALFEEKERAQVTLNSIGDAVVSTDFRGMVTYLNIVAVKMTGWSQTEAEGHALEHVFPLVDALTGEKIACLTTRAIIEDRTVAVDSACVLVRRDGAELAVENTAAPIHDRNGGVIGAVMVAHDVTAARELSRKLAHLALHDSLTDLPNRTLFRDRLTQALVRARRDGSSVALFYVDLDRFKQTNDSLGHNAGDLLLQGVARRLLACARSTDTVSRLGGDEFVLVLTDVHSAEDAVICADKIVRALGAPFEVGEFLLHVTASIGIAVFPDDSTDADTLLRFADLAMYEAKYVGRDNYQFFKRQVDSASG